MVAVTSVAVRATIDAMRASSRQADFGRVLLLSHLPPPEADPAIEWRSVERLDSRRDYSRFMLRDLADHIATSHALCVQWDGFVVNGAAWQDRFLDYDYIGAVWPHFSDGHRVGNGGFSLRSRRLLKACKNLPFDGAEAEDIAIARTYRSRLEDQGMRFAPEAVAQQFAYERSLPSGSEFGFHGAFNLVRYLSPDQALKVFRSLDKRILAKSERME
jgi:hypothetical protein